MKRLNSLVLLSAGIAAGAAGNYWLTNCPEPVSTPAAAEQSHLRRVIAKFSTIAIRWAFRTPRRCRRRTRWAWATSRSMRTKLRIRTL